MSTILAQSFNEQTLSYIDKIDEWVGIKKYCPKYLPFTQGQSSYFGYNCKGRGGMRKKKNESKKALNPGTVRI